VAGGGLHPYRCNCMTGYQPIPSPQRAAIDHQVKIEDDHFRLFKIKKDNSI
jgi:hypothetical protein